MLRSLLLALPVPALLACAAGGGPPSGPDVPALVFRAKGPLETPGPAAPVPPATRSAGGPDDPVRIAAFYRATPTGERHVQGVRDAVDGHPAGDQVQVLEFPYVDEREGDRDLEELLLGRDPKTGEELDVDLVLGPTDSGVFVRAKAREEELAARHIPVISSLVVADAPNEPDGWFFRTNVDVVKRAGAIYDHLAKRWVTSIAVLHANSEFGRVAEESFAANLNGLQKDLYRSYSFEPGEMRRQVASVLDERPEAVGIFGSREDIVRGYKVLLRQNDSIVSYRPVLFTVVDIRSLHEDVDDFYYVSVVHPDPKSPPRMPAEERIDNVHGLSYDTTRLVLDEIASLEGGWDPETFRDRFASNVLVGEGSGPGQYTGMRFTGRKNSSEVYVYRLDDSDVISIDPGDVGLLAKLEHKTSMIWRRYGLWPALVALAMLGTIVLSSLNDFRRWYGGKGMDVAFSRHFLGVVALQGSIALFLFVYLCETGTLRYDGVIPAVLVALSPSPILRTTLLRVGGKAIGFSDLYDRALKGLTEGYVLARYDDRAINERFVAYYNSYEGLRRRVDELFRKLPNNDEAARLQASFEREVDDAKKNRYRERLACARILVQLRTWEELKAMGLVPPDTPVNPEDPQTVISRAVHWCMRDRRTKLVELDTRIAEELESYGQAVRDHYEAKLRDAGEDPQDQFYARIQFLKMRFQYDADDLREAGFLGPETEEAAPPAGDEDPKRGFVLDPRRRENAPG